jgi:hypothetical protein
MNSQTKKNVTLVFLLAVFLTICGCAGNKQTIESTTRVIPKAKQPSPIAPEAKMAKPVHHEGSLWQTNGLLSNIQPGGRN